jgi:CPA1 family monovalent cation:H+ antiporter
MSAAELERALGFAGIVVAGVIVARLAIAFLFRAVIAYRHRQGHDPAPFARGETLLVGWAGMRGLVTLAAAFALPQDFPERDLVVVTAFAVVLATLVLQGATLAPMIRLLKLGRQDESHQELEAARRSLAAAALERLDTEDGPAADALRMAYREKCGDTRDPMAALSLDRRRQLSLAAVQAQRRHLDELRNADKIGPSQYLELQEDLDWKQLAVVSDEDRRITES